MWCVPSPRVCKKRAVPLSEQQAAQLAQACEGFSGAEIEQAVVAAVYAAHAENQEPNATHILKELQATRPLSTVMAEKMAQLRLWARDRTVQAE